MLFGRIWSKIKFIALGDHCRMNHSTKHYSDIATAVIYIRSVTEAYVVLVHVDQKQMSKTD